MVILHAEDQHYYGESFEIEFSTGAYSVDKINLFTLTNIVGLTMAQLEVFFSSDHL